MAIAYEGYVDGDAVSGETSGDINLSGRSAGQLGIVFIARYDASYGNEAVNTSPSGWTLLQSNLSTTAYGHWVYYKILAAGDLGTLSWTWTNAAKILMHGVFYSGIDSSAPITQSNDWFLEGSGATFQTGGITTSEPWVVAVIGGLNTSTRTFTAESGWSERRDHGSATPDMWHALEDTNGSWGGGSCNPTFDSDSGYVLYGRYGCIMDLKAATTTPTPTIDASLAGSNIQVSWS